MKTDIKITDRAADRIAAELQDWYMIKADKDDILAAIYSMQTDGRSMDYFQSFLAAVEQTDGSWVLDPEHIDTADREEIAGHIVYARSVS